MNEEQFEERKEKTLQAMNLLAECLRINCISDSISISAMSSLIANILVHHHVPRNKVDRILQALNEGVSGIGGKFSGYEI